ncbi:hypothetical protein JTE90_021705 [Oedothorax gibbosus]|uniref:Uncharacterized protein n=1 Tax=Oedothorax gibbosus TaxID=931172 RepID=A0AAV6TQB2_9ARAC|nr:hypothetical protein JTE90_021705 [Oedothorax gibbosus]
MPSRLTSVILPPLLWMRLQQNRRRAHPAEYESGISTDQKKARWSDEETAFLAQTEAELCTSGRTMRFMNLELSKLFRTELLNRLRVKGKNSYRSLVQSKITFLEGAQNPTAPLNPCAAGPSTTVPPHPFVGACPSTSRAKTRPRKGIPTRAVSGTPPPTYIPGKVRRPDLWAGNRATSAPSLGWMDVRVFMPQGHLRPCCAKH